MSNKLILSNATELEVGEIQGTTNLTIPVLNATVAELQLLLEDDKNLKIIIYSTSDGTEMSRFMNLSLNHIGLDYTAQEDGNKTKTLNVKLYKLDSKDVSIRELNERLKAIEASQNIQDGAIAEVAEVVATIAEGGAL